MRVIRGLAYTVDITDTTAHLAVAVVEVYDAVNRRTGRNLSLGRVKRVARPLADLEPSERLLLDHIGFEPGRFTFIIVKRRP